MNDRQLELSFDQLIDGQHERCQNPQCRMSFGTDQGKLIRMKGLDGKWYCDAFCASEPFIVRRFK